MSSGLMSMLLSEHQNGNPEATALLQGLMGPGTGTMDALRRPVIDPQTGQRDVTRGSTGEMVVRGDLLPAGVNDRGQLRPAVPNIVQTLLQDPIQVTGDIVRGKSDVYDQNGEPNLDVIDATVRQAAGLPGQAIPKAHRSVEERLRAELAKTQGGGSSGLLGRLAQHAMSADPDASMAYADSRAGDYATHVGKGLYEGVKSAVKGPIDAYRGDLQVWDPATGHTTQEAWDRAKEMGGLAQMGGIGGAGSGAGTALGSGPIRKRAVKNLGMGADEAAAVNAEIGAAKGAKYPQYAEQYPPQLPGKMTWDDKLGKEYMAKQNSPEALEFGKERAKIEKDMAKNGFEPYFNPAERRYANASDPAYTPNTDTLAIKPRDPKTLAQETALFDNPEARARIQAGYQRGTEMPNTKDWYAMGQLEDAFKKELGPEAGPAAFRDKFATSMAATTGGAAPKDNLLMAQYGNYLREKGLPYPEGAYDLPFPIGGRFATGNMNMHKKVFDQGGFAALDKGNPKRHNFAQNFMGNRGVATIDEQMTSGMVPGMTAPNKGRYGVPEQVVREEAAKAGVEPANFQDVAWSGLKNLKDPKYTAGQPMIQTVNEAIERTHRLTGMPKDEIVRRGLVRGEIPLYSNAGGGLLGSLMVNDPQERSRQGR